MFFYYLLLFLACFMSDVGHAVSPSEIFSSEEPSQETISLSPIWSRDFNKAFSLAQKEKKILVVAFLGDSWCPWSEKLKKDILNSPLFVKSVQEVARCAVVNLDEGETAHNRHFREVFHVDQTPALVLFDYSQEEIARLGFLPLSAEGYADQVLELVQNFERVIAFLKDPKGVSSEELIVQVYADAKKLSSQSYRDQILEIGLKREKGSFFILEKYAHLLDKLKFKSPLVQKTRKELMAKDPHNQMGTQLKIAVLEFQKLSPKVKGKNRLYKAISPLLDYVRKFGKEDPENLWKVEMMMAQFLFAKNEREMALSHAKASLDAAPEIVKSEVKDVVDYLTGL